MTGRILLVHFSLIAKMGKEKQDMKRQELGGRVRFNAGP